MNNLIKWWKNIIFRESFFWKRGSQLRLTRKLLFMFVFYKTNTDSNFLELIMLISAETMW